MNVDAESPGAPLLALRRRGQAQREIDCALFGDALADARRHERIEKRRDVVAGKGIAIAAHEPSADAEHGRGAGDEQQIAGPAPRDVDQQRLQRISARQLSSGPGGALSFHCRLALIEFADELFQFGIRDESGHASKYERIMPEVTAGLKHAARYNAFHCARCSPCCW